MSVIVIAGMIGLGKTSVAEVISDELNSKVFYESVDNNPILPLFYSSSEEEITKNRYPFLLQLHFLNSRFKSIKEALKNDNNVLDRSIYEDLYFATKNHELGRISDLEMSIYKDLLNNMMEELSEIPKKKPDLMIYLSGSFDTVLNRINMRGREYEVSSELIEYYRFIWEGYDDWVKHHYSESEVLEINMDEIDIVNSEKDRELLIKLVKSKIE